MLGSLRLRKWCQDSDGATSVEFGLLAIPYFMLSLAIIELSLVYASASLLEGATGSAARLIRTGQIQQAGGDSQQMFTNALCDYVTVLFDCNDIVVEVQTMDSYNDFDTLPINYSGDGNLESRGFDAGGSNDRVLIRTGARYEMMTPFIGDLIMGDGGAMTFISTLVLQTEPYEFEG